MGFWKFLILFAIFSGGCSISYYLGGVVEQYEEYKISYELQSKFNNALKAYGNQLDASYKKAIEPYYQYTSNSDG